MPGQLRKVYKFDLHIDDRTELLLPRGAQVLDVQPHPSDRRTLQVWALVDVDAQFVTRTFHIRGTGHPIEGDIGYFIKTVHAPPLVWHVFDDGEPRGPLLSGPPDLRIEQYPSAPVPPYPEGGEDEPVREAYIPPGAKRRGPGADRPNPANS